MSIQVHRSVKYMTAAEREARKEEVEGRREVRIVNGEIRGEWELEHTYMCASCAEPFDELREVSSKLKFGALSFSDVTTYWLVNDDDQRKQISVNWVNSKLETQILVSGVVGRAACGRLPLCFERVMSVVMNC